MAAVLVLAGAFTAVFVLGRTKHDPSQSKESSPTSQMSSASDADPLRGSPEKDNKFLWRLTAEGLQLQLAPLSTCTARMAIRMTRADQAPY